MSPRENESAAKVSSPEAPESAASANGQSENSAPTEGGIAPLLPAIGFVAMILVFIVIGLLQR